MKYLATAALVASCAPAYAQTECAATQDVYDIMKGMYGEERHARGLSDRGFLTEIWGNEETGTWTIIATSPEGISCVLDQGQNFTREELKGQL